MKAPLQVAYRYRRLGKGALGLLGRALPPRLFAPLRKAAEQIAFRARPEHQSLTLPSIFHYWSVRYLTPMLAKRGIDGPEGFYLREIVWLARDNAGRTLSLMSLGSGDCSLEIALAGQLRERGIRVRVSCVDFNAELLARGAEAAGRQGLAETMEFLELDCNRLPELPPQDAIVVNQFFHHVEDLEGFCRSLRRALRSGGRLLTCDVIGRNGHLLWPDVEREVAAAWATLPADRRFDRYFDAVRERYQPVDHAAYSNEGIRAQDVVRCLLDQFDFEMFLSYGGAIIPFVERRIGFNFDPASPEDQAFIDDVAQADVEALVAGRYPAANMMATLVPKGEARHSDFEPIPPSTHAALTQAQARRVGR